MAFLMIGPPDECLELQKVSPQFANKIKEIRVFVVGGLKDIFLHILEARMWQILAKEGTNYLAFL